jgi:hypothetical protein
MAPDGSVTHVNLSWYAAENPVQIDQLETTAGSPAQPSGSLIADLAQVVIFPIAASRAPCLQPHPPSHV